MLCRSQVGPSSASWAWSSFMPAGAGHVVPFLAERQRDGDGAAVEDPGAGVRVGVDHPAGRDGLGVGLVAHLDVEPGGLDPLHRGGRASPRTPGVEV